MSLKSILRAVGARWQGLYPWTRADSHWPLGRLTARRDWPAGEGTIAGYAERTNENTARLNKRADPWPPTDDPYAKAEPCPVVPDAGLERVRKLTERGMVLPIGNLKTLSDVMELIDRQEDAERHLRNIGMIWERGRGWYLP